MPAASGKVYLTFDDGPDEKVTPFVLDCLKSYDVKATFFLLGKNAAACPELCRRILSEGHTVGNHTFHHSDGWKTSSEQFIADILLADQLTGTKLFRPPYGRWPLFGCQAISAARRVIMWDVMSYDYRAKTSPEQCRDNVIKRVRSGSIIVFHDSPKAYRNLAFALPATIEFIKSKGLGFAALE